MSKIRSDLVGVVFVPGENGTSKALVAGDEIPDGVTVGPHLLDDAEQTDPADDGEPKAPHGNASRATWAEYATGLDLEFDEGATRDEIKALVKAQD